MDIINFVDKFNWQTIIGMLVICWYFTHDIKVSMEKQSARADRLHEMFNENCIKQSDAMNKQSERSDKLYQMFIDLLREVKK